jgi:hypothetical protein
MNNAGWQGAALKLERFVRSKYDRHVAYGNHR